MSAADVASPFASLVRSLVARETDHEQIATACGVPRTLAHDERTAAILETLRVLAGSRSMWHSEALTFRACFRELCAYAGAAQPADDAPPSAYLDALVAISEARRDHLAGTLALLGLLASRNVDETLHDLRTIADATEKANVAWSDLASERGAALAQIAESRDAWRRDASNCADALAAVAEALGIEPTYDPARGTETGARVRAAIGLRVERCAAAETALTDIASALGAQPCDPYSADSIAVACLETIARDHETAQRFLASAEATRADLKSVAEHADRAILEAGNLREHLREIVMRAR